MKKQHLAFIIILNFVSTFYTFSSVHKTIESRAGNINSLLTNSEKESITDLKIKGEVDKRDFDILKSMSSLLNLDLKEVTIKSYSNHKENTIPNFAFYNELSDDGNEYIKLQTIILPENIEEIGENAFKDCWDLKKITLSNGIKKLGKGSFANCSSITEIKLPETINSISSNTFFGCSKLNKIDIPFNIEKINSYTFFGCENLKEITFNSNIKYIDDYAFSKCSSLSQISFGSNLNYIGDYSFAGNDKLEKIEFNSSNTNFGEYSFAECSSLNEIKLPNSLQRLGNGIFYNCQNIENINLPTSLNEIGEYSFFGCEKLKNTEISSAVNIIGKGAFTNCRSLTNIIIPEPVKDINEYTFAGCDFLTEIRFEGNISSIGDYAFNQCYMLEYISPGNELNSIGEGAFANCSSLKEFNIPHSIKEIKDYTFFYCENMENITLSNNLTKIGDNAFNGCSKISLSTFPHSVTYIGENAFEDCILLNNITFNYNINYIRTQAFSNCNNISSITTKKEIPFIINEDTFSDLTYNNTILYIPAGTKTIYETSDGWRNFNSIKEISGDINSYNLTIKTSEGGKINIDGNNYTDNNILSINSSENKKITVIPDYGFELKNIWFKEENITDKLINNSYILSDITNDTEIRCDFGLTKYYVRIMEVNAASYSDFKFQYGDRPVINIKSQNPYKTISSIYINGINYTDQIISDFIQLDPITQNISIIIETDDNSVNTVSKIDETGIKYWSESNNLFIFSNKEMKEIRLFDIDGKEFLSLSEKSFSYIIPVENCLICLARVVYDDDSTESLRCIITK